MARRRRRGAYGAPTRRRVTPSRTSMGAPSSTRGNPTRRGGTHGQIGSGPTGASPNPGSGRDDTPVDRVRPDRQRDAYDTLLTWLTDWDLADLASWAWEKIQDGASAISVLRELREHPIYKARFPENDLRKEKDPNFRWMSEAEILAYRNDAASIGRRLGLDLSLGSIQKFISNDRSLSEFESTMKDYFAFLNYGDVVKDVFETRLGHQIDDPTAFAILSNEIPTPDFDRMFDEAIFMGQPTILGMQIRPIEEVRRLMQAGYTPAQGFELYKRVASALPDIERIGRIDSAISSDGQNPFDSFEETLGAFSGLDIEAQRRVSTLFANETARNTSGGQTAFQGTRALALEAPQ